MSESMSESESMSMSESERETKRNQVRNTELFKNTSREQIT